MVNTCSVTYCETGYKWKGQVAEYHPAFGFPDTKPSSKEKWLHFVNRKHGHQQKIRVFVQNTLTRST